MGFRLDLACRDWPLLGPPTGEVLIVTLLPLTAIVTILTILNLEHVVYSLMAGIREQDASSADTAYSIVMALTLYSWLGTL